MAARFDTTDDLLYLNGALGDTCPVSGDITWCHWLYLVSDRNVTSSVSSRISGQVVPNYYGLRLDATGTGLQTVVDGVAGTASNLNLAQWYHVAYRRTGNTHDLFLDGILVQTQTATPVADSGSQAFTFGGDAVSHTDGRFAHGKCWEAALTAGEIESERLSAQPKRFVNLYGWWPFFPGATERTIDYGGNARTLRVNGTLADEDGPPCSWGGSPIIPLLPKSVAADAGSYALSGTAASVLHKYIVSASAGAYTLTGTAATLRRNLPLVAGAGSYTLTGSTASLLHKYVLTAGVGSYALTGTAAALKHRFAVAAGAGSYTLTGTAAGLRKTWLLGAGAGAYALTGSAATLRRNLPLIAGAGSYTLTGTAATLRRNLPLVAGAGAYTLTGSAVTLTYLSGKTVVAGAGAYSLTGTVATLLHKYIVTAGAGSYSLSGVAAALKYGRVVTIGAGSYTVTGSAAALRKTVRMPAASGSYVLTGNAATLRYSGAPPAATAAEWLIRARRRGRR